jgi:hypothetical protein
VGETRKGGEEKTPKPNRKMHTWNTRQTCVDPQRLVQRVVERDAVVAEFLPQRLLGSGLAEVGRRCAHALPLLL